MLFLHYEQKSFKYFNTSKFFVLYIGSIFCLISYISFSNAILHIIKQREIMRTVHHTMNALYSKFASEINNTLHTILLFLCNNRKIAAWR